MNIIGPQVKALRERQDLTLKELELKLNSLGWGISHTLISKIEKKKRKVSDTELVYFCEVFNVNPIQLLNGDSPFPLKV